MSEAQNARNTRTQTHSGKLFDIFNPRPEDICIEDIAHALSMQCRFNGHTKQFYSVAEHSLNCARIAATLDNDPEAIWLALMHDAHEAYIGDLPGPWVQRVWIQSSKNIHITFDLLAAEIEKVLIPSLSNDLADWKYADYKDLVKYCDFAMLLNEKALSLQVTDIPWSFPPDFVNRFTQSPEHALSKLEFFKPAEACFNFLKAYEEITQCLKTGSPVSSSPLLSLSHLRT